MNKFAYRPNPTGITFLIQNATGTKFISVFNNTIAPGAMLDLMAIPGISEEQIRSSLIKGELYARLRTGDIKVINTSVNLLNFDPTFQAFLHNNNIVNGTLITEALFEQPPMSGIYNYSTPLSLNSVVYLSAPDTVSLANATSPSTQPVIGFVETLPSSTTALIKYYGELTGFTGLIPSATYYLSDTLGVATANPPTTTGQVVQKLGFAKDATTMVVMIDREFVIL